MDPNSNNNNIVANHINCPDDFDNTSKNDDAGIGVNNINAEVGDADNRKSTGEVDVEGDSDNTGVIPEDCVHLGLDISYSSLSTLDYV